MKIELKRVVITGMGAITPLGNTVDEFWKNIAAGKSGVAHITKFDTADFKTTFAAEVKGFNAAAYFDLVNQHGRRDLLAGDRINDWWRRVWIWFALQVNHFNAILTKQ